MAQQQSPYDLPDVNHLTVGFLGGTGDQGRGLARRLAMAGHQVLLGSRREQRAVDAAESLGAGLPIRGVDNATSARDADIVVVTIPWDGHRDLLASLAGNLAGKIVLDCVNPMEFDKRGAYAPPVVEGSAAEQAAALLPDSRVVAAFHHVSAVLLLDPEVEEVETDILVLGEDREATDLVQALAGRIPGMRGIYAGRLRNARQVEALTANLVSVNRRYKAHAGIRITDV